MITLDPAAALRQAPMLSDLQDDTDQIVVVTKMPSLRQFEQWADRINEERALNSSDGSAVWPVWQAPQNFGYGYSRALNSFGNRLGLAHHARRRQAYRYGQSLLCLKSMTYYLESLRIVHDQVLAETRQIERETTAIPL